MRPRHRLLLLAALAVLGLALALVAGAIAGGLRQATGIGWIRGWMLFLCLPLVWIVLPRHLRAWPGPYTTQASIVIAARPDDVWRHVFPRAGARPFTPVVDRIDAVAGAAERFDLVYVEGFLPKRLPPLQVKVEAQEFPRYFRLSYPNRALFPMHIPDIASFEFDIREHRDGSRVTLSQTFSRLRPVSVLTLLCFDECGMLLRSAKAVCEGKPDKTWVARLVREIQRSH